MIPSYRQLLVVVCATLASGISARAQAGSLSSSDRATLAGTTFSDSTHPLAGVEITLVEANRSTISTTTGAFRIPDLTPGAYTLTARRLGYATAQVHITLAASQVSEVDIELEPVAQRLSEVRVKEVAPATGTLAVIARRNAGGGGTVIAQATLDSARGSSIADVRSRRARGIHLQLYPRTGAMLVASSRGAPSMERLPRADPSDPTSPSRCYMQVFVDGIRIYSPTMQNTPVPDLGKYDAAMLEAVEFYAGPATTPPEFSGTGAQCGTVALWTRTRE